jgi:hypothetical protein
VKDATEGRDPNSEIDFKSDASDDVDAAQAAAYEAPEYISVFYLAAVQVKRLAVHILEHFRL